MITAAAAFALVYLTFCWRGPSWPKSLVKTASTALLALAAWPVADPRITAGLALGSAGDFFLSRPGQPAFLAGMAAFALGHLAYAAAFWQGAPPLWALGPLVALGLSTEVWLAPHTGALRWPVRGYVAVILVMAAAAATLPPGVTQLGAALFVLSDLLLAILLFRKPAATRALSYAVWLAYWTGQALILRGSL